MSKDMIDYTVSELAVEDMRREHGSLTCCLASVFGVLVGTAGPSAVSSHPGGWPRNCLQPGYLADGATRCSGRRLQKAW